VIDQSDIFGWPNTICAVNVLTSGFSIPPAEAEVAKSDVISADEMNFMFNDLIFLFFMIITKEVAEVSQVVWHHMTLPGTYLRMTPM
jgi:hypothetical protein